MRIIETSVSAPGPSCSERRGVTLLELLVVLLLLGVTAAVVYPSLPRGASSASDDERAMLTTARRAAVRRGEPLRLRLDNDGVWALVALRDGEIIQSGQLAARSGTGPVAARATSAEGVAPASRMVITIDAMGSCVPSGAMSPGFRFDPIACAWQPTSPPALP